MTVKPIKKKARGPIDNRYSYSTTSEQVSDLDMIKKSGTWDVNAMFRECAEEIIKAWKKEYGDPRSA